MNELKYALKVGAIAFILSLATIATLFAWAFSTGQIK